MSKLPTKTSSSSQVVQTFQKNQLDMPAIREARPLAVTREQNALVVAYKDLNLDVEIELRKQKQQMVFAFALFAFFGVLIVMAQWLTKPRGIASTSDGSVIEGTPTKVERYHYDKTCIKTSSGEEVCNTRESRY